MGGVGGRSPRAGTGWGGCWPYEGSQLGVKGASCTAGRLVSDTRTDWDSLQAAGCEGTLAACVFAHANSVKLLEIIEGVVRKEKRKLI